MIKLYLVIILIIHIFGIKGIINSGDRKKLGMQFVTLAWCSILLVNPQLNAKLFIFLLTMIYLFASSVLLWAFNKTNNNLFTIPFISQAILALLGLMALFS